MDKAYEELSYSQKAPASVFFLPHEKEETWSENPASGEASGRSATDGSQARTSGHRCWSCCCCSLPMPLPGVCLRVLLPAPFNILERQQG